MAGANPYPSNRSINLWFDPAAFTTPAAFTWGTLGRNSLNAPTLYNFDFSIAKRFKFAESRELQFRTEFFNAFNHPQFGLPNATIGVGGAGTITGTQRSNRQIQFALRSGSDAAMAACLPCMRLRQSRPNDSRFRPVLQYDRPTFYTGARGMLASATRVYRFGVFELNATSRELFRNGREIRIQEQPRRLLEALLKRHGELVTRDELREKLWPTETFVEFDDGLNTAVQKIRQVIGDEARNPRFVETVCGVDIVSSLRSRSTESLTAVVETPPASAPTIAPTAPARRVPWTWICAAAALAGLAVGSVVSRSSGAPRSPALKLTITPPAAVESSSRLSRRQRHLVLRPRYSFGCEPQWHHAAVASVH